MEPTQTPFASASSRRARRFALLMMGVILGTCVTLDAMANSIQIQRWIRSISWEQSKWKKQIPMFCTTNHFIDPEDRLIHEQIPAADFSHGGVYFVGASNLTWGLKLWDLPAVTRALIHNLGCQGYTHADQFDLIRFLVESEGLLEAGADKTLIVIAADYHMTHRARIKGEGFDPSYLAWDRRNFYTVGPDGAIRRSGLNPVLKTLIRERVKITGLLKELVNIVYTPLKSVSVQDPHYNIEAWTKVMHPDWRQRIAVDLAAFEETVKYLRSRGAKVTVIQMPRGDWEDGVPFNQVYDQRLQEICAASGVAIHDYTGLVGDADFADSVHLNPSGIEKFQAAVMPICLDHLRSAGALPADDVTTKP
jgi:hypothetical protein